jgi:hypothetical protein
VAGVTSNSPSPILVIAQLIDASANPSLSGNKYGLRQTSQTDYRYATQRKGLYMIAQQSSLSSKGFEQEVDICIDKVAIFFIIHTGNGC